MEDENYDLNDRIAQLEEQIRKNQEERDSILKIIHKCEEN